jgi:hypothetical protein
MGRFYTGCRVENHTDRSKHFRLPKLLVDTGSEYTWLPTSKLEEIDVRREKKDLQFNGEWSIDYAECRVCRAPCGQTLHD